MNFKETDLIEKTEARNKCINHVDVLEKVGNLITLPNGYTSLEKVAMYYNVGIETIKNYWKSKDLENIKQELIEDGAKVFAKSEIEKLGINLKTKQGGFDVLDEDNNIIISGSNRGVTLLPKRAVLRIGMVLTVSDVAKELRTRLLDIFHEAEHNSNIVENVFQEIRSEQEIAVEMSQAILVGDFAKLSLLQTELISIKNKRINMLENTVDILVDQYTTFDEFKRVANACMRAIASKDKRPIEKMWGFYYKFLYDKEGISVNTRYKNEMERVQKERIASGKKPYTENTLKTKVNKLRTIKPSEYNKCLNVLEAMAVKYGVDIEEVVRLNFNK